MSSASQPREWAMNGKGGNTKPSSDQNVRVALRDGARPGAGVGCLGVVPLAVAELQVAQLDVLRIGVAALRLVERVLEQRVRRGVAGVHVIHRRGGDAEHPGRGTGRLGMLLE